MQSTGSDLHGSRPGRKLIQVVWQIGSLQVGLSDGEHLDRIAS
jgi:hypothetical protein